MGELAAGYKLFKEKYVEYNVTEYWLIHIKYLRTNDPYK